MSEQKKATPVAENEKPRPLEDAEAEKIVGGTGGDVVSQAVPDDYDPTNNSPPPPDNGATITSEEVKD